MRVEIDCKDHKYINNNNPRHVMLPKVLPVNPTMNTGDTVLFKSPTKDVLCVIREVKYNPSTSVCGLCWVYENVSGSYCRSVCQRGSSTYIHKEIDNILEGL